MKLAKREPVLESAIYSVAGYLLAILVVVGALNVEQESALLSVVATFAPAAAVILNLVLSFLARQQVTPVDDPRDDDGRPLVAAE